MELLNQDGFVIFISGGKNKGKTNFAMLLNEISFNQKLRNQFATNIHTECYYMGEVNNYPDLENWLKVSGKKTYTLDEAGKHIKKFRFMSDKNTRIMDLLQLIRHYDAGFIGVAPNASFVDSNFLNTDILDAHIVKINRVTAKVTDYYNGIVYFLFDIPQTKISHNGKDIAPFSMEKEIATADELLCCQIARLYRKDQCYERIGKNFNITATEVRRELVKHLEHTSSLHFTSTT
jgi:hypothetical protein